MENTKQELDKRNNVDYFYEVITRKIIAFLTSTNKSEVSMPMKVTSQDVSCQSTEMSNREIKLNQNFIFNNDVSADLFGLFVKGTSHQII